MTLFLRQAYRAARAGLAFEPYNQGFWLIGAAFSVRTVNAKEWMKDASVLAIVAGIQVSGI